MVTRDPTRDDRPGGCPWPAAFDLHPSLGEGCVQRNAQADEQERAGARGASRRSGFRGPGDASSRETCTPEATVEACVTALTLALSALAWRARTYEVEPNGAGADGNGFATQRRTGSAGRGDEPRASGGGRARGRDARGAGIGGAHAGRPGRAGARRESRRSPPGGGARAAGACAPPPARGDGLPGCHPPRRALQRSRRSLLPLDPHRHRHLRPLRHQQRRPPRGPCSTPSTSGRSSSSRFGRAAERSAGWRSAARRPAAVSGRRLRHGAGAGPPRRARGGVGAAAGASRGSRPASRVGEALHKWIRVFYVAWWGAAVVDGTDQRIEAVNPAFARLHGYDEPASLAGGSFADLLPPERAGELGAVARPSGGQAYESDHLRPDGTPVPVLVSVTPLDDGEHSRLVRGDGPGPHRPQADRGAAAPGPADGGGGPAGRRRRARSQQHDDDHPRLQRPAGPGVERARRPAARGGRDPEGRACGRPRSPPSCSPSAASRCCSPTDLRLNAVVEEMAPVLRLMLPANVRVETSLAPLDTVVRADRSQLEQVLINLAFNARDAMASGGTIRIDDRVPPARRGGGPAAHRHPDPARAIRAHLGDRQRSWDGPDHAGACLRAVLHHQAGGLGHRAGPLDGLRDHQAERRIRLGRTATPGQGTTLHHLPAGSERRRRRERGASPERSRRRKGEEERC